MNKKSDKIPLEEQIFNRRNLLEQGVKKSLTLLTTVFEKKINRLTGHLRNFTRPPGAIPEHFFRVKCSKCGKCAEVCPNTAIKIADINAGLANAGFPYIDVLTKPCVLCTDLPCIESCKDEALIPIRHEEIFLGKVEIEKEHCLTYKGQNCISCSYGCTIKGALVFVNGKPKVDPNHCVGCGICYYSCVANPKAVHFVPKKENFPNFRLRSQGIISR
jgi:MauM/NapG family ferredoxin protein